MTRNEKRSRALCRKIACRIYELQTLCFVVGRAAASGRGCSARVERGVGRERVRDPGRRRELQAAAGEEARGHGGSPVPPGAPASAVG